MTDYACTANDWSIIANIRKEVSVKRNLVCIEDAFLKKPELLLLLTPGEFVGDEVSIYIYSFMTRWYLFNEYVLYI